MNLFKEICFPEMGTVADCVNLTYLAEGRHRPCHMCDFSDACSEECVHIHLL